MEPIQTFEPLIWKCRYPGDLSALRNKTKEFLNTSTELRTGLEMDGGLSSFADRNAPHAWNESAEFVQWLLYGPSTQVWNAWGYPEVERWVGKSWANKHPKGAWTDEHTHGDAKQVIVLYLDQPENGGNLEIVNPLYSHWQGYFYGSAKWREVKVETGDVLIFPPWLEHRSQRNQSDAERMVISLNIVDY